MLTVKTSNVLAVPQALCLLHVNSLQDPCKVAALFLIGQSDCGHRQANCIGIRLGCRGAVAGCGLLV